MGSTGKTSTTAPYNFGWWDYEDEGWNGQGVQNTLAWFKQNSNLDSWQKSLSKDEISALSNFTDSAYSVVNKALRSSKPIPQDVQAQIDLIKGALDRFVLKKPMVVARTADAWMLEMNNPKWAQIQGMVGKTITTKGFLSANSDKHGSFVGVGGDIEYKIEIPAGKGMGAWLPTVAGNLQKNESEFLINIFPNRQFQVTKVERDKTDYWDKKTVYLKMV